MRAFNFDCASGSNFEKKFVDRVNKESYELKSAQRTMTAPIQDLEQWRKLFKLVNMLCLWTGKTLPWKRATERNIQKPV